MASEVTVADGTGRNTPETGLLRNRAFVLFCLACGLSVLGDHLGVAGFLGRTGPAAGEGKAHLPVLTTFAFMLPFFVVGPLFGMLADRLPRRGLMLAADLLRVGLMLGCMRLLDLVQPMGSFWAATPLVIGGLLAALFSPARAALMPMLVGKDWLVRANAVVLGLSTIAVMAALVPSRHLAERLPAQLSYWTAAVVLLVSAILLFCVRPMPRKRTRVPSGRGPIGLVEAVTFVCGHRRVARLIGVAALIWGCGAVVWNAIPLLAWEVYGQQSLASAVWLGAFLGIGLLAGAMVVTSLGDGLRGELLIIWSLLGLVVAGVILVVSVLLPISPGLGYCLGAIALVFAGAFGAAVIAAYHGLLQRIVPNRLRGRVFGLVDSASAAGLLLATGLLGIPRWSEAARWIGWVLLGVTAVLAVTAVSGLIIRLRRGPLAPAPQFWWHVNEFYCKWWFRLRREGPCTVPAEGPVIVVANHTCGIDPLLLIASTPYRLIGFLVAEEFSRVPIGGRLIRMIGCVPVRRDGHDAAGTRAALRHLRDGNVLGIFIEGGIPEPGEVREPKLGAAMLALHSGALIVPAYVSGTIYDENVAWSFLRRHRGRVRFGKPIDLGRYWIPSGDKEALRRVSIKLLEHIRSLAPEGES